MRRQPTMAYYLALAAALVGFVCLAIAADGTRRALAGGDGLGALSGAGVPAIIVAWAIAFYARLAFSPKLTREGQRRVHGSLRILMGAELLGALVASWYVLGSGAAPGELRGILIVGDVLQVGTVLWILRYHRE